MQAGGAAGDEAIDEAEFGFEVAIIPDDKAVDGGGVATHRFVVRKARGLMRGPDTADEFARGTKGPEGHVAACGAVGTACADSWCPTGGGYRRLAFRPRFDFIRYCGIVEVFHACKCTGYGEVGVCRFWWAAVQRWLSRAQEIILVERLRLAEAGAA